jgi:lipopolysaccharide biosynthesis regulator YciM
MQLSRNNVKETIQSLLKITDDNIKYSLSIISSICSLYLKLNDFDSCIKFLDEASLKQEEVKTKELLIEKSAFLKLDNKLFKEACESFEKLFNGNNKKNLLII